MLYLHFLGFPEIRFEDKIIDNFISNKVHVLLAYLVLNPNIHSRERLASLLWEEMPTKRAKANLRQALHNLQTALPEYITADRQTVYFISDLPYQCDVELLQAIDEALGKEEVLTEHLQMAVDLYRGRFLEGIVLNEETEIADWIYRQQEMLQVAYIRVLAELAQRYVQSAEWSKAEQIAQKLLNIDAWHESAHVTLMLSLAKQGQYSAALARYQYLRQVLEEELGVSPSPETTALAERIRLAQASRPVPPALMGACLGREQEREQISVRLQSPTCRCITLRGMGGVGKTRLAHAVANDVQRYFINGVCLVLLAGVETIESVSVAVADSLGVALSSGDDVLAQLLPLLQKREVLLVLDNIEHLTNIADWVIAVMNAAPDVKIMTTSRTPLNLRDEWVFPVNGLAIPSVDVVDDAALRQYAALQLMILRLEQAGQPIEWPLSVLADLCRLLEGAPLAIELACSLLSVMSPQALMKTIRANLDVLHTSFHDIPKRHRSMRAVYEQSWQLLSEHEQEVLRRLAVFRGRFSAEAAAAVAGASEDDLQRLIERSLLGTEPLEDCTYFRLHQLVRQYSLEHLKADASAHQDTLHKLCEHYEQTVGALRDERLLRVVSVLSPEFENVQLTWETAIQQQRWQTLGALAAYLHRYFEARSSWREGIDMLEAPLRQLELPSTPSAQMVWGKLCSHVAGMFLRLGRVQEAYTYAEQSVAMLPEDIADSDILKDRAFALNVLGIAYIYIGRIEDAIATLQSCAELYGTLNMPQEQVKPYVNLSSALVRIGRYDQAVEIIKAGLEAARMVEDINGQSHLLTNLGVCYQLQDNLEEAAACYQEALPLCRTIGNRPVEAICLSNLGEVMLSQDNYKAAIEYANAAKVILSDIHDQRNLLESLNVLAIAHVRLKQYPIAKSYIIEALQTALKVNVSPSLMLALLPLGLYYQALGNNDEAFRILSFVGEHPATEVFVRKSAQKFLSECSPAQVAPLSDEDIEAYVRQHLATWAH